MKIKETITLLRQVAQVKGSAEAASIGFQALAQSLHITSAGFAGLAASLGPVLIALIAVTAAVAALEKWVFTADNAIANAQKSAQSYEEQKAKVESLNSELETTQSRIDELKAKGSLTIVEQQELANLELTNEKLEHQLEIEKQIAQQRQSAAAHDANEVFTDTSFGMGWKTGVHFAPENRRIDTYQFSDQLASASTILDYVKAEHDILDQLDVMEEDFNAQLEGLDPDSRQYKRIQAQIADLQEIRAEIQTDLATNEQTILDNEASLYDDFGNVISDYEGTAQDIKDTWEYLKTDAEKAAEAQQAIRNYISSQKDDAVNDLLQQAKDNNGITADDIIAQFTGIEKAAEEAGLSVDEFAQNVADSINSMAGTINVDEVVDQLRKMKPDNIGVGWGDWYSFIDEMAQDPAKLKIVYDIVQSGADGMTIDDFIEKIDAVQSEAEETIFSLADALDGFDDVASKIGTLSEALEKLEDGEMELGDVIKLIEQFPELADYVDFAADNFGDLDKGLKQLRDDAPTELVEELRSFAETADLTDQQRASISALCDALEELPNVGGEVDELAEHYGGLADVMDRARQAADELSASLGEDTNDAYVTRAQAIEEMIDLMEHGATGSESKLWQIAESFGLPESVVSGRDADALAELIALRQQWYDGATDDRYSYEGIQNFIGYVTKCKDAFADLGVTFEYVNGELSIDIPSDQWYAFADSIGVSSDELADLLIQIGQFYGLDFSDIIPAEIQAPEITDPDPVEVTADTSAAEEAISGLSDSANDIQEDAEVIEVDTEEASEAVSALDDQINNIKNRTVTITARVNGLNNITTLASSIRNLPTSKTITVTTITKTVSSGSTSNTSSLAGKIKAAIAVNGTAHASGTWGSSYGGRALVGELGREIYVDPYTSQWQTVGENGAEFINIRKGGIIFNHRQTEALLSNGYVAGRGRSLASGTALVTGGGALSKYNFAGDGGYSKTSVSTTGGYSSSNSSSYSTKSGTTSKTSTDEDTWFEKQYKYHNHLINMEQEDVQDYLTWLNEAYQKAYNEGILELADYYQYQEEVFDKLRELYKDSLNDIEHTISMLEHYERTGPQIVAYYKQMMASIEDEIIAARQAGLDDTDDYIQELQDRWWQYSDAIIDLAEDTIDDAEDALDDLIRFRMKMIEKDLKKEKDALNTRLDNLKDFYDEQKKMLEDAADEDEYLDEQTKKRKQVSDLELELQRLELDDSAWASKRKLELREQLAEAREDLDKFEKDHALEVTKALLDQQYEMQAATIQAEIDQVDTKLDDERALYDQALEDIRNDNGTLMQEMIEWNAQYGSFIDRDVTKMWEAASTALQNYQALYDEWYQGVQLRQGSDTALDTWDANKISGDYYEKNKPEATSPSGAYTETSSESSKVTLPYGSVSDYSGYIQYGSRGNGVKAVQYALNKLGYGNSGTTSLDGIFGTGTRQAVYNFQKAQGLQVDGIVGPKTKAAFKNKGYASGTSSATPGIHEVDEYDPEYLFTSADGSRYRVFSGGEKVLDGASTDFLYKFATSKGSIFSDMISRLVGILPNIIRGGSSMGDVNMGDIHIHGNASERTVSEIRRAQRENVDYMLKQFHKLNV